MVDYILIAYRVSCNCLLEISCFSAFTKKGLFFSLLKKDTLSTLSFKKKFFQFTNPYHCIGQLFLK